MARTVQLQDEQVLKNLISKDPLASNFVSAEIITSDQPTQPAAIENPSFEDSIKEAFAKRDRVIFDVAMDILVPPLTYLLGLACLGTAAAVGWALLGGRGYALAIWPWALSVAMIVTYVLRGLVISETGLRGLLDLAWAPVYIAWKLALSLSSSGKRREGWVRTTREDDKA